MRVFPLALVSEEEIARQQPVEAPHKPATPAYLPVGGYAVIRAGFAPDKEAEVQALLDRMKQLGVEVVDQRVVDDALHAEAMGFWAAAVSSRERELARRMIADLRRRRLRDGREWPFSPDETEIGPQAGDERVREVLEFVGLGDQLGRVREEGLASVAPPARLGNRPKAIPLNHAEINELRDIIGQRDRLR